MELRGWGWGIRVREHRRLPVVVVVVAVVVWLVVAVVWLVVPVVVVPVPVPVLPQVVAVPPSGLELMRRRLARLLWKLLRNQRTETFRCRLGQTWSAGAGRAIITSTIMSSQWALRCLWWSCGS